MSAHEQFADDLALLALGALQGDERVALEKHLEECSSCRRELERLRGDMALLALSAAGPAPPRRSRERLLKAIAKEPRAQKSHSAGLLSFVDVRALVGDRGVPAAGAVFFLQQSDRLSQRVAELQDESAQQQAQLERAREVVSTLTSTDAMRVTLVAAQAPPQPQGKAIYVRTDPV